jgi:hypothetical protein
MNLLADYSETELISTLTQLECAFNQIMNSGMKLPDAYLHKHQNLANFLQDPSNILANAKHFSVNIL